MSQVVKKIKPIFEEKVSPLVDIFYRLNITPNILTISGVLLVILGSYVIYSKQFFIAGLFILLGNICDALDGSLARRHNQTTKFGA
ncbi:MAG: CDP-alcohol phosphatidyltransferase family protein, partial [Aquificota bacterium]